MVIRKVDSGELKTWVQFLTENHTIFAPQAKDEQFTFDGLEHADDLRFDYDVSILPPKRYLQPQQEVLLTFTRDGVFESVMNEDSLEIF
ncbi:MAG: hypothetical protein HQ519_09015 [Planctomycetes bacterium]|nr:hypothetical protein [Planctomycetota bacterium]